MYKRQVYERFIGNYAELEKNWYQFLDKYKALLREDTILAERFFNDPAITGPTQCICDICTVSYTHLYVNRRLYMS